MEIDRVAVDVVDHEEAVLLPGSGNRAVTPQRRRLPLAGGQHGLEMLGAQYGTGPLRRHPDRRPELALVPGHETVPHGRADVRPAATYCLRAVVPHLLRALELVRVGDALGQPHAVIVDDGVERGRVELDPSRGATVVEGLL